MTLTLAPNVMAKCTRGSNDLITNTSRGSDISNGNALELGCGLFAARTTK